MTPLKRLNEMDAEAFIAAVGHVFEHSPWIAQRAAERRPFAGVAQLHEQMCDIVRRAPADDQLALIRAHPDLVGRMAQPLTRESHSEQAAAGLTQLSPEERDTFNRFNAAYSERFGFPFVICARENRKDAILAAFPRRLENTREAEIATAIDEICKIARLRLLDAVSEEV